MKDSAAGETIELKTFHKLKSSNSSADSTDRVPLQLKQGGPQLFLIATAITCALTAFHFGYAITSINVPSRVFFECKVGQSPIGSGFFNCFEVNQSAWGLVAIGLPLGGWIGGSLAPALIQKCKSLQRSILFLNIPLTLGYIFMSLAVNLPMLILGRLLLGFASGASGMMVPLYLSSVSPIQYRGIFTNFFQLFLCSGLFIAEIISFAADLGQHPWHWRLSFAAGLLVIAIQIILVKFFNFLPETPRDLDSMGNVNEARLLRNKLGIEDQDSKNSESITPSTTSTTTKNVIPEVPPPASSKSPETLLNLLSFRIPAANKSLALGIILHAGQQISGVNAIFFYSSLILKGNPWTPVLLAFINLAMTVVAIWLLDRAGRRPVALFSVAGSAFSLIALSAAFIVFPSLVPLLLVSFVFCFALGLGPLPWMLVPELFPPAWPLTPAAISFCVAANRITDITISGIFPLLDKMFRDQKYFIFLTFGVSCSLLFIYLHQFLPETKNRPSNFI